MYAERQMQTGKTDLLFLIFLSSINKTFFSDTVILASTFYKYLHFKTNSKYIIIYTSIETVKAFCPVKYSILFVAQERLWNLEPWKSSGHLDLVLGNLV